MKKLIFTLTVLLSTSSLILAVEKKVEGVVFTSDGQPASGAYIAVVKKNHYFGFSQGRPRGEIQAEADSIGRFSISLPENAAAIVFVKGVEAICLPVSEVSEKITLQKAASIWGTFTRYGKAVEEGEIRVAVRINNKSVNAGAMYEKRVKTDKAGVFETGEIPAGRVTLSSMDPISNRSTAERSLHLSPGEKASSDLGGNGVDITGRLKAQNGPLPHSQTLQVNITTALKIPEPPSDLKTEEEKGKWRKAWYESGEGEAAVAAQRRYSAEVLEDGTFKAENLLAGEYVLSAFLDDPNVSARGSKVFTVDSTAKQPIDVGEVELKILEKLKIGQEAPDFTFKTFDGKEQKLSDYRGKWVLIDFWATWCGPCVEEMPKIKEAYDALTKDNHTAFISLSLDKEMSMAQDYVRKNAMPWIQGFLGEWSKTQVPNTYGIFGIPAIFLISPEGKIAARDLRGEKIKSTLQEMLKKAP